MHSSSPPTKNAKSIAAPNISILQGLQREIKKNQYFIDDLAKKTPNEIKKIDYENRMDSIKCFLDAKETENPETNKLIAQLKCDYAKFSMEKWAVIYNDLWNEIWCYESDTTKVNKPDSPSQYNVNELDTAYQQTEDLLATINAADNLTKLLADVRQRTHHIYAETKEFLQAVNSINKEKIIQLAKNHVSNGIINAAFKVDDPEFDAKIKTHFNVTIKNSPIGKDLQKHLYLSPVFKLKNPNEPASSTPKYYGVFTSIALKKGMVLGEYTGDSVEIKPDHALPIDTSYSLKKEEAKYQYIDAKTTGNVFRWMNHSTSANCTFGPGNTIIAIKDINPGEQLIVDYGPDYKHPKNKVFLNETDNQKHPGEKFKEMEQHYYLTENPSQYKSLLKLKPSHRVYLPKIPNISEIKAEDKSARSLVNASILVANENGILTQQPDITLFMATCAQDKKEQIMHLFPYA